MALSHKTTKQTGVKKSRKGIGGQPTKFRPEYVDQAYKYCLLGANNERLGEFFMVTTATIENWLRRHPDFRQAVHDGRHVADAEIAHSLYQRAKGGMRKEEQAIKVKTGANQEEVVTVTLRKEVPSDTRAAHIWLLNRRPDKWKERREVNHSGSVDLTVRAVLDELDGKTKGPSQYRVIEGEARRIDGEGKAQE